MWWLSFVDPDRRPGDRFVGAVCVRAATMPEAIGIAHRLGINPGGRVAGVELLGAPPDDYIDRLLSREDIAALDRVWLRAERSRS